MGRRIRELRGFDTNQVDFASSIGVAQSHVSAVERGEKELGAQPLLRIAQIYDRSLEWLLTGRERINSEKDTNGTL